MISENSKIITSLKRNNRKLNEICFSFYFLYAGTSRRQKTERNQQHSEIRRDNSRVNRFGA